jgi:hypothetical protein
MCFRNKVRWDIHQDDDPRKFMTVGCGEYVLAIPDYTSEARQLDGGAFEDDESSGTSRSSRHNATFKKVVMKLSGDVRWLAGLVFERDLEDGGRSFDFIPHYEVALKNPKFARPMNGRVSVWRVPRVPFVLLIMLPCSDMTPSEASAATTFTCRLP